MDLDIKILFMNDPKSRMYGKDFRIFSTTVIVVQKWGNLPPVILCQQNSSV